MIDLFRLTGGGSSQKGDGRTRAIGCRRGRRRQRRRRRGDRGDVVRRKEGRQEEEHEEEEIFGRATQEQPEEDNAGWWGRPDAKDVCDHGETQGGLLHNPASLGSVCRQLVWHSRPRQLDGLRHDGRARRVLNDGSGKASRVFFVASSQVFFDGVAVRVAHSGSRQVRLHLQQLRQERGDAIPLYRLRRLRPLRPLLQQGRTSSSNGETGLRPGRK